MAASSSEISASVRIRVRFSELDPLNMVWHGNYVKYLEDAREAFGHKYGIEYFHIFESGYLAPVYDMHIRYEQMASLDDELEVTAVYKPALGAKLCFDYEIRRLKDNARILTATTIQLFTTVDGVFEPSTPEFFKEWKKKIENYAD